MAKITIYITDIRQLEPYTEQAMTLLSPRRREKALAMVQPRERMLSIGAGLLLRKVFGGDYPSDKKRFSISHGGNYAVLAVAEGELGVDIEPVPEGVPEVPEIVFTEKEMEWLREKPTPVRFAVLWTRLESVLKAHGGGFEGCDREYSVFDSQPWHITTLMHDGHVISVAAGEEFEVRVEVLSLF